MDNVPIWDTPGWASLPALRCAVTADVCVVGLGGSGLACIDELLTLGASVVGLDAGAVAGGGAGRNGGFLLAGGAAFYHDAVARHGREASRALYAETLGEMRRMQRETPDAIRRCGTLRIAADDVERADCAAQLAAMRADDLPAEPYSGPEGDGLLFPADGAFNPLLRCRTLALHAIGRGARLYEHSRALTIAGGRVTTAAGEVRCRAVVVAVDGGLELILPELSGEVRSARLQMLACAPTDAIRVARPVYARYGYTYWQQLADGSIAIGGFRDLDEAAEWTCDPTPTATVQRHIERFLRDDLGVAAPITHRWGATVSYTADGLPLLREVRPGVVAVGAYSGTGNVVGALFGRRAARLALTSCAGDAA